MTVQIICETEAPYTDLEILDENFKQLAKGAPNSKLKVELPSGAYYVLWRVFGTSNTKYKIKFSGVKTPKKPVDRKIHVNESIATGYRYFTV